MSQPTRQKTKEEETHYPQMNTTAGFHLEWRLQGSGNDETINEQKLGSAVWKKKSHQIKDNLNIMTVMNLVRESKIHGVEDKKVLEKIESER